GRSLQHSSKACVASSQLWHFFFQAEDGIRDSSVTGVQTCALPIFNYSRRSRLIDVRPPGREPNFIESLLETANSLLCSGFDQGRSEERRVGKDWRCGV